ncbi:N-acetyltransferase [Maricaulis sp.]|uniref:GNAT family N-acetyltransferase n=1 Tax=Maricaulis sp. TaxID=1486257 RepID=UPI00260A8ED4|nr:N-acetyltransferase [Maricaulis sp.]
MQIRPIESTDSKAVGEVLDKAFKRETERLIGTALRAAEADTLELVAEIDGQIVGAIMFSPATGRTVLEEEVFGLALGPVAVLPEFERCGIGSALIDSGLDFIRQLGVPFCMLLGHPDFYRRFNFKPAANSGWTWDKDPSGKYGDAFQLRVFDQAAMPDSAVAASFHPAFDLDNA